MFKILKKILHAYEKLEERNDIYKLITELGINLEYASISEPSKIFVYDGINTIILKINQGNEGFYILHEIGHFLLHARNVIFLTDNNLCELEANIFVCIFLLKGDLFDKNCISQLKELNVPDHIIVDFNNSLQKYLSSYDLSKS